MNRMMYFILIFVVSILSGLISFAAFGMQNRSPQADKIIVLAEGGTNAQIDSFVTIRNIPAEKPTKVSLARDDSGLIVRFDCADDTITALKRPLNDENIWKDDCIELFLDVGHTHDPYSNWLHVIVNAVGSMMIEHGPIKGYFASGDPWGGFVARNAAGVITSAEKTKKGWSAEIRIPWATLGKQPSAGDVWGFNVNRTDYPSQEYSGFSPTWGSFLTVDQWGHIVFADKSTAQGDLTRAVQRVHEPIIRKRLMKEDFALCHYDDEEVGQTWVDIKGEIYGAKPDERGPIGGGPGYTNSITRGDYYVTTLDELVEALRKARSGQIVFIDGDVVIDCTVKVWIEGLVLKIPAGVTLASDRGHGTSRGALIFSDTFQTSPLFECLGPNVRITGLRIKGPDTEARLDLHSYCQTLGAKKGDEEAFDHEYYYKFPTSNGIRTQYNGLEVDNCEVAGWSCGGIYLEAGERLHIHHNYIHHNQRNGLGYGVCLGNGKTKALIEQNLFTYNRHSIAGTGVIGCSYEAWNNVELGQSLAHCFDMHGGKDRKDGTNIAGTSIKIHHNTFRSHEKPIKIRGVPLMEAVVNNNWFLYHKPDSGDNRLDPVDAVGKTRVINNAYGAIDPSVQ